MNAVTVLTRELREESRRPVHYGLRVFAAGGLTLLFIGFMLQDQVGGPSLGANLFRVLERTLYWGCWIVVPLMTADCISRELREGTLGLLFLTPLSVKDVLAGKACVHGLRAAAFFLATAPILGLPFVLGGLGWQEYLVLLTRTGAIVLLGIAAGLCASCRGGTAIQAMVRAEVYAVGLLFFSHFWLFNPGNLLPRVRSPGNWAYLAQMGWISVGTLLMASMLFRSTARHLRETWQQEAGTPEQPRWVRLFSDSDFWQTVFHWNKNPTLDRNPVAWLQEYSWTARLTKWAWCLLAMVVEGYTLLDWQRRRTVDVQLLVTAALAAGVAFSAAGSFRRERQSGLLELLLVTPISVRQLLAGRLWGFFCHYFPAFAVLSVGWIGELIIFDSFRAPGSLQSLFVCPIAIVSIMVIGPCLALARFHFLIAWVLTWLAGFALPLFVFWTMVQALRIAPGAALVLTWLVQLLISWAAWAVLTRSLRTRRFALAGGP